MPQIVVNISDMKVTKSAKDVLATYSLGSCIGLAVFDPQYRIGGLIHCLLPTARNAPDKAEENPYMFISSGVPMMVRQMIRYGAKRTNLIFKAAGGANMRGDNMFMTGDRNRAALLRLLEKNGIRLKGSDFGGTIPRTMYLHMDTGRVVVKSFGKEREL